MSIIETIFRKLFPWANLRLEENPTFTQTSDSNEITLLRSEAKKSNDEISNKVDIEKILDELAAKSKQRLNWRTSVVDLLFVLGIDNSLHSLVRLAKELNFPGDATDTAMLSLWLHREIIVMLANNGGVVPPELIDHPQ